MDAERPADDPHARERARPASSAEQRRGARGRRAGPERAGDDERALVLRAKQGDRRAREELIDRLRPGIVAVGRRYCVDALELDDVIQEGAVGVLEALAHYEPERATPFSAYARWWIRRRLQELRAEFVRPLRIPPKALCQLARLKAEQRACAEEGPRSSWGEVSERLGIDAAQVEALLRVDRKPCSLYEPLPQSEGQTTPGDLLPDGQADRELERLLDAIAARQLLTLVDRLPVREREVLSARFGLDGRPPRSLDHVGRRLGLSGERVRQLERQALARLASATPDGGIA